jgi:hypothetical protein
MRVVLSYFLLLTLTLSGLTGSVQAAYTFSLADTIATQQHQHTSPANTAEMPCHSVQQVVDVDIDQNCCQQIQHQCQNDCCAKHCATANALLAAELFRYIRPGNSFSQHTPSLPQWLFAEESPPPIIS